MFENQEDLLQEFSQFLPDATNNSATQAAVSDIMDQYRTHHGVRVNHQSLSVISKLMLNMFLVSVCKASAFLVSPTLHWKYLFINSLDDA